MKESCQTELRGRGDTRWRGERGKIKSLPSPFPFKKVECRLKNTVRDRERRGKREERVGGTGKTSQLQTGELKGR